MGIKLASETIHYAVEALMFDRKHALDVIKEEGNGLNEDQKDAICQKIQALQERPKTIKEKNRLENRLIGVLQPATLAFLEKPGLIARVIAFSNEDALFPNPKTLERDALAIQTTSKEINYEIARTMTSEQSLHLKDLIYIGAALKGIKPEDIDQWGNLKDLMDLCVKNAPNFSTLIIEHSNHQIHLISLLKEAIANCGKKTKFRRIEVLKHSLEKEIRPYLEFPYLAEVRIHEPLIRLLTLDFSRLRKIDIRILASTTLHTLSITPQQKVDLILRYRMEDWVSDYVFLNQIKDVWVELPITGVDLSDSEARASVFQPIAKLPKLLWLDLSRCKTLDVARIAAILKESKTLRTLLIEPHESLSVAQIADLQEQYPLIDITTQHGIRFRDALTEEGLLWV